MPARTTPASRSAVTLESVSRSLNEALGSLAFRAPVTHVYNPLSYAWRPHAAYLERYGRGQKRVLFLGMNPGPFGMAQTGVPFGDVRVVRDFLQIEEPVQKPEREHPKRPVLGFGCPRAEVSGTRLWGWVQNRFSTKEAFFADNFVVNYCPLLFLEESGKNRTPDALPAAERERLFSVCDAALRETARLLRPEWVVGVGAFAEDRARRALDGLNLQVLCILHPSPANPRANRDWAGEVERAIGAAGLSL